MSDFKPGDWVRVTYEAKYDQHRGTHHWLRDLTDGTTTSVPADATIELIEPADDPSKDEAGAVRRGEYWGVRCVVALSDLGVWKVLFSGGPCHRRQFDHHEVVGWEKLEPVDGTPAAEPKVRYFQDREDDSVTWRALPNGQVEFRPGRVSDWARSHRFVSLSELLEDEAIHEVPEP